MCIRDRSYNSDWTSENVYGRPDPIYMYKSTTRTISLALIVPAATTSEGFENLSRVQKLVQFLYPTYKDANEADTISQSPLVRLQIMNLFADRSDNSSDQTSQDNRNTTGGTYNKMLSDATLGGPSNEWTKGNLGVIGSLAVNHNLENPNAAIFEMAGGVIIPQMIEINLDFNVIHEHGLGWEGTDSKHFKQPLFPYGVNLEGSTAHGSLELKQDQADGAEVIAPANDQSEAARKNAEANTQRIMRKNGVLHVRK